MHIAHWALKLTFVVAYLSNTTGTVNWSSMLTYFGIVYSHSMSIRQRPKYEGFLEFWHLNAQLSKIIKTLLISSCSFMYGINKIWNFLKISLKKPQKNTEFHVFMVQKNKSIKWNSWIFSYKFQNFTKSLKYNWTNNLIICSKKFLFSKKISLHRKKIKNSRDNFFMQNPSTTCFW